MGETEAKRHSRKGGLKMPRSGSWEWGLEWAEDGELGTLRGQPLPGSAGLREELPQRHWVMMAGL